MTITIDPDVWEAIKITTFVVGVLLLVPSITKGMIYVDIWLRRHTP